MHCAGVALFFLDAVVEFATAIFPSIHIEQINEGKFQLHIIPICKEEHHEKITVFKSTNHCVATGPFRTGQADYRRSADQHGTVGPGSRGSSVEQHLPRGGSDE